MNCNDLVSFANPMPYNIMLCKYDTVQYHNHTTSYYHHYYRPTVEVFLLHHVPHHVTISLLKSVSILQCYLKCMYYYYDYQCVMLITSPS